MLAWKEFAINCTPNEACGFVTSDDQFIPCDNISETPEDKFEVPEEQVTYALANHEVIGFLHSHTTYEKDGKKVQAYASPSAADMECQARMRMPWGISVVTGDHCEDPLWFGDQLPRMPLIGRQFYHGVTDCFSLIRDWHAEKGIFFDDVPRGDSWWEDGDDLYTAHFESRGFVRITHRPILEGDCFICNVRSKVLNHAGLYIGDGLIMHHIMDRLSRTEPASIWQSRLNFIVRHKDLSEEGCRA